jgi:hypothetical protein
MGITRAANVLAAVSLLAEPAAAACSSEPRLHALDFWLGTWSVQSNGETVGIDVVESILGGCAILERWTDAGGGKGLGLFWFDARKDAWQQVWVTDDALQPFGTKQKSEVREFTAQSRIRFAGRHAGHAPGREVLDRTTLTRLESGMLQQRIEISDDEGQTWKTIFDAAYLPPGSP